VTLSHLVILQRSLKMVKFYSLVLRQTTAQSGGMAIIILAVIASTLGLVAFAEGGLRVGFRAGDRPEDADVNIERGRRSGEVIVSVRNPQSAMALVSCSTAAAGLVSLAGPSMTRTTAWRQRNLARHDTFLGAVAGHSSKSWLMPLPSGNTVGTARITVSVEQAGGRTRVHKYLVHQTDPLSTQPQWSSR
jgi:hypothetical protein